ncbi:uncharacterized protein LOC126843365 [Adelges cooleyi]|uniref:uncharacterized protein LOC126843365 n=1 Tax=Adelges cooleyi TaxID=133065 RepID=UPI00217F6339|nr:uncharacterized protein LOC126843365 [Adelges cooleyi]
MNIKFITLICLVYCIAKVNSIDPADEAIAKSLIPARVFNWNKKVNRPSIWRQTEIEKELLALNFSPKLVKDLIRNSAHDYLPASLKSYNPMNDPNIDEDGLFDGYKCKRIPGEEQEAVIVFHFDNTNMPENMKADPGFIVFFYDGAIEDYQRISESDEHAANALKPARVSKWGHWLSPPPEPYIKEATKQLIGCGFSPELVDVLMKNSYEKQWPAALYLYMYTTDPNKRHTLLDRYRCKRIPGDYEGVIIFHYNNKDMPEKFKANPGFVVMFGDGAIDKFVPRADSARISGVDNLCNILQ